MTMHSGPDPLPVIDSLDDLVELVTRQPDVFLRYSEGPQTDSHATASCDYEADVLMPGLSVSAIAPQPWWPRPAEDWIARRIRQYAQLHESGRFAWVLTGRVVGCGPDHEPLVTDVRPIAALGKRTLAEAAALYRQRFNVGRDSRTGRRPDA
ncbi:DUF6098 family protein [Mycobacterium sp. GA-2829]|uniref:DUF6098 family protein n=1 Tax=Mycobacterium sp. GA-2829 TaxID=1772283 RepID=UPI0007402766|nr:DUF6098 family protein [Mycobacterium sp. GA-2829]KUI30005.1 hypothetical protein AU194_10725 [Mycobacterium sp. GA-2829]